MEQSEKSSIIYFIKAITQCPTCWIIRILKEQHKGEKQTKKKENIHMNLQEKPLVYTLPAYNLRSEL